jgi:hypothetical protein
MVEEEEEQRAKVEKVKAKTFRTTIRISFMARDRRM